MKQNMLGVTGVNEGKRAAHVSAELTVALEGRAA